MKQIYLLTTILFLTFINLSAQESYLGDIKMTAIDFNQRNWTSCEGQLLQIASNTALFSLLGTQYGGDGRTSFALPDLRSRVPVGQGQGLGLPNYRQGQRGGSPTNTLTISNLPAHSHSVNAVIEDGNSSSPANNYPAGTKLLDKEYASEGTVTNMNTNMIGTTGRDTAVNNMQPYIVIKYVICVSGLYPSRN
jgi:microcystin-dependent protein